MKLKTRLATKQKKAKVEESLPEPMSQAERSFEQILQRERTVDVNDEGYHFIRPKWHRWVYGGGKQGDK